MTVPNESAPFAQPSPPDTSGQSSAAETAKSAAKSAAGQASEVAGAAADNARAVATEATNQAKAVVAQAKDHVQSLAQQTKGELMTQADTKGQQAASALRNLSGQLSALGDGRPGDAGQLADYVRQAEGKVSALASRIEQGGPQGVLEDLTGLARRRPAVFLLGAIGAGFVVGRLVRSGTAAAHEQHDDPSGDGQSRSGNGQSSYAQVSPTREQPLASLAAPVPSTVTPSAVSPSTTSTTMSPPPMSVPPVDPVIPGEALVVPPAAPDGLERMEPLR
jgi:hypothetical protein